MCFVTFGFQPLGLLPTSFQHKITDDMVNNY